MIAAAVAMTLAAGVGSAEAAAGARASTLTRLGRVFRPGLSGFGKSRPHTISLGGDPTSLVTSVHWSSWGGAQARGGGDAEYVWPGTAVADNPISPGARVVAFHLGTCRGVRSYNALEWYFPRYGETFDPHAYINTCTGMEVGSPHVSSCFNVMLRDGAGNATSVITVGMSCASAVSLIADLPVARYLPAGGRFTDSGFRCGSEGTTGEGGTPSFACQSGSREFAFTLEP